LELDKIFLIFWYDLKLSLGLFSGISYILSLGWGSGRPYLSKRKNKKKSRLPWVYLEKIFGRLKENVSILKKKR